MSDDKDEPPRLNFLQTLGSAFAAAFGVQSRRNRQRDFAKGSPAAFIVAGLLATALFVGAVITVVQLVLVASGVD